MFELWLIDSSTNSWIGRYMSSREDANAGEYGVGRKALSGTLTTIRLTSEGGTDTFDAGAVNVIVE